MKKLYLLFLLCSVAYVGFGQNCVTVMSTDVPLRIPSGISSSGSTVSLLVGNEGIIADLDVVNLIGTHSWIGDLEFILTSPLGTTVSFITRKCGSDDDFNLSLDDEAVNSIPCPYNDGGTYLPDNPLSAFDGESSVGEWTLTIIDYAGGDIGELSSWGLNFCYDNCIDDIIEANNTDECGAVINYTQPDSWSIATVTQIDNSGLTSGDEFPVGITEQSYRIDDGTSIDTCSFNVTVVDTTSPEVWCQNIGVSLDEEGQAQIYPVFILDSVSDNCGIDKFNTDINRFDCGDVGENIITLTVKDINGNLASCSSVVTVKDNFAPTVVCRDYEVAINEDGIAEISVDSIDGGSTDACGIAGMELSQSVFTGADLGENIVTLYVTDVNGNSDSCNAAVTVTDELAPVAVCNIIEVLVSNASGYELSDADLAMLAAGSSDNSTPFENLIVEANPSVFTCDQIGDSVNVEVSVIDDAEIQVLAKLKFM